jgi:hypothetical protein
VLIVAVATTGRMKMMITPAVISMALAKHLVRRMTEMKIKKCCANCSHVGAETTNDVACCNCCEDMEFYDELPADLCIEFED